ncbi:MAG: hypothetical protein U1F87_13955 [Kiritimatiellia bacterium]
MQVDDGAAAVDGIFSGALTGSGALNKTGSGTLLLPDHGRQHRVHGPGQTCPRASCPSVVRWALSGVPAGWPSGGATLLLNNNPDNNTNRLNVTPARSP